MSEFIVRYAIEGEVKIEAETAEEAQEMFEAMDVQELALTGDLMADAPKTEEQIKREISEALDSHARIGRQ